jgi:hypothetical protein
MAHSYGLLLSPLALASARSLLRGGRFLKLEVVQFPRVRCPF